jgi:hypothetical protein
MGGGADRAPAATARTVPVAVPVSQEARVVASVALGADEAVRPAHMLQQSFALRFRAVAIAQRIQGHALFQVDRVLGHRRHYPGGLATSAPLRA